MKNFINLVFVSVTFTLTQTSHAQCPVPPTKVIPEVSVKIDHDKSNDLYTYIYTLLNRIESPLSIGTFILRLDQPPHGVLKTTKWISTFNEADATRPSNQSWGTIQKEIQPGQSETFILRSYRPPGNVKYFVEGATGVPQAVTVNGDPESFPDCPGFFFDKPRFESMTTGITQGPAMDGQLSVNIKIKQGKHGKLSKTDRNEIRPYQEVGLLTVVVKSSKDFDVSDIDVPTLRFGMGKAAPVWHELRPGKNEKVMKKLWVQFDLDKADIECDRDRVLFLEGKTKDGKRTILGGSPVKVRDCQMPPTNPRRKKEREKKIKMHKRMQKNSKSKHSHSH